MISSDVFLAEIRHRSRR